MFRQGRKETHDNIVDMHKSDLKRTKNQLKLDKTSNRGIVTVQLKCSEKFE